MNTHNPFQEIVDIRGLLPLASDLGVSYQAVQKYLKTQVPSEKVIPSSKAVDWVVTPHRLRPDLYPHPNDGLPPELRTYKADGSHDTLKDIQPIPAERRCNERRARHD